MKGEEKRGERKRGKERKREEGCHMWQYFLRQVVGECIYSALFLHRASSQSEAIFRFSFLLNFELIFLPSDSSSIRD